MFLKASFKNAPVLVQFLMLFVLISACTLFSSFLILLFLLFKTGTSLEALSEVLQNLSDYPDLMRGTQFLQSLGVFLFPAIIGAWLFSDNYKAYFGIDQPIRQRIVIWTAISMIVAVPFLNWTYALNQQMVFPEALKGIETWMKETEAAADRLTHLLLDTNNIPTIVLNILIICVIAALCEEFMFRGLLQTLFGRVIRNPHVIIWIVAILFSAIHLQFYGFITRMFLGAWLGYLMYFTKTIWIPVWAHFVNNFISIAGYYLFRNTPDELQKIDTIGSGSTWWLAVASFALFIFCVSQIKKATAS